MAKLGLLRFHEQKFLLMSRSLNAVTPIILRISVTAFSSTLSSMWYDLRAFHILLRMLRMSSIPNAGPLDWISRLNSRDAPSVVLNPGSDWLSITAGTIIFASFFLVSLIQVW